MPEIRLTIESADPTTLDQLVHDLRATPADAAFEREIQVGAKRGGLGLAGSEVAVDIAIKIAAGVATKVISDWLTAAMAKRKVVVKAEGKQVEPVSSAIERIVRLATLS